MVDVGWGLGVGNRDGDPFTSVGRCEQEELLLIARIAFV